MAAGRPTSYSKALIAKVCRRVALGESLRSVSRDPKMPTMSTLFKWLSIHPEFTEQYRIAKEETANVFFEDMIDIADLEAGQPVLDKDGELVLDADGKPLMVIDSAAVNHARLRVDTRKWVLSRLMPKKYGDRITQDVNVTSYQDLQPDELERKIQEKQQQLEASQVTH